MKQDILGWFWHEWRGSYDGRPSMLIRTLLSVAGYRIDLHKFIRADDATCFHTHPATAYRIILWGGYIEEHQDGRLVTWAPGCMGWLKPEFCHRIHALRNGRASYSIWLRGRKRASIKIYGEC